MGQETRRPRQLKLLSYAESPLRGEGSPRASLARLRLPTRPTGELPHPCQTTAGVGYWLPDRLKLRGVSDGGRPLRVAPTGRGRVTNPPHWRNHPTPARQRQGWATGCGRRQAFRLTLAPTKGIMLVTEAARCTGGSGPSEPGGGDPGRPAEAQPLRELFCVPCGAHCGGGGRVCRHAF